ncbi:MAG: isocitrate lyase/phosphoenolpyruvate mutase family protein, partial [Sphingomonadales bacterium]|nr:isocitrate lyase/phosphoenolpyruvate mutase family protein [Sphingomonadales bacterium]
MSADSTAKATRFRELHEGPDVLVMPNPWDLGSARILAGLGFKALATSSAGFAHSLGRLDYGVTRAEAIAHGAAIAAAVDVPVSADLENGFGHTPEDCAETMRLAVEAGLAGASIEDASGDPTAPIYDIELASDRIAAAADALASIKSPLVLTGRAENFLHRLRDLDDTIRRLQAYEAAGADVLYAPGLTTLEQIKTVCEAVSKPVNVLMGLPGVELTVADVAAAGARRISTGSTLALAAFS